MKERLKLLFSPKKGTIQTVVDIAGVKVHTKDSMKVLGVMFDDNLTWEKHVRSAKQMQIEVGNS